MIQSGVEVYHQLVEYSYKIFWGIVEGIMKIAVCFFGHLRTFKRCAPYIKFNLLKHYDCDLFMHTWSEYNHQTKTWHENKSIKGKVSQQEIIDTYGEFKRIIIEDQIVEDLGDITIAIDNKKMSLFGLKSMYYSMQSSYNLSEQYAAENNVNYDLVVMIRPDIALASRFNIEHYISILTSDELLHAFLTISNNSAPINAGFKYLRAIDLLFIGKPQVISEIVNHTNMIVQDLSNQPIINCVPEFKFIEFISSLGINLYEIKYDGWDLVRPLKIKDWIKQLIRIRINRRYIKIQLLRYYLINIFSVRINLFNFEINCCIGKSYSE